LDPALRELYLAAASSGFVNLPGAQCWTSRPVITQEGGDVKHLPLTAAQRFLAANSLVRTGKYFQR
jgi:hypothetical protein